MSNSGRCRTSPKRALVQHIFHCAAYLLVDFLFASRNSKLKWPRSCFSIPSNSRCPLIGSVGCGVVLRICAWPVLSCSSLGACGRFSLRNARCANVVRRSGLEQQANEAIESELGWMSNPDIVGASDAMDQGRLDEAAAALQKHRTANPPSIDALNLLQLVQWRRQDMPAYLQATWTGKRISRGGFRPPRKPPSPSPPAHSNRAASNL